MLFVPFGKNPPFATPTVADPYTMWWTWFTVRENPTACVGSAATIALGELTLPGNTSSVSTEPSVDGAAELPTVSVARSASTLFAAARYGYAEAEPAAIARPVSDVRTYPA
jgi:hypothetical protein